VLTLERGNVLAWRGLVRATAIVAASAFALTAVVLTDVEAGLFAIGIVFGLALLRFRRGLLGLLALGLLFADTAAWMIPGTISNIRHGQGLGSTALPATLGALSLVGLAAVAGCVHGRADRLAKGAAIGGVLLLTATLAVAAGRSERYEQRPGAVPMETKDVRFSPDTTTSEAGQIEIALSNKDLFWHTFTIRELHVDVRIPSLGKRRVVFEAQPGTYEFVCAIPGHTQAGMKGTLTVR
jgi:plastocyanin